MANKKQANKERRAAPPIHINNTGRIVFNKKGAERIGRPTYMDLIIKGDDIRLIPTDEASDHTLDMSYPKKGGPYTSSATLQFEPLGFEPGPGKPSYPIDPKPYGDDGFEFPSPFRKPGIIASSPTMSDLTTPRPGDDWLQWEVDLVVEDYFSMLLDELNDVPFVKAHHWRALMEKLTARSKGSVEYKYQNISFVLYRGNLPYVSGYPPARSIQGLLVQAVENYFDDHPWVAEVLEPLREVPVPMLPQLPANLDSVTAPPPKVEPTENVRHQSNLPPTDWDAFNRYIRVLGQQGEEFALEYERRRLWEAGRTDLAKRVKWISRDEGDWAGYDIGSHEANGDKIKIEVKTTNRGINEPFYVTANELRCSREAGNAYRLYRVFRFSKSPQLYKRIGPLEGHFRLDATVYVARP